MNIVEPLWRDTVGRPPDFRFENGGAWKLPNGKMLGIVAQGPVHWWNNGWIPIDTSFQKTPSDYRLPHLGVVVKEDETVVRHGEVYRPVSVGCYDGALRSLYEYGGMKIIENEVVWKFGPYEWKSVFGNIGWEDKLTLHEKPELHGSYFLMEHWESAEPKKSPFALDARHNYLPLEYSKVDDNYFLLVPNEWLDSAIYPVVIDPTAGQRNGCKTGGWSMFYAPAGTTCLMADSKYSPASCGVGQFVAGGRYFRRRGQACVSLQSLCCFEITSAYLRMALITPAGDFSVQDFDVEIQKFDWVTHEQTCECCDHCDVEDSQAQCDAMHVASKAAAVDVTWRNTAGIAIGTYYNSPALDVTYINSLKRGCGWCVYYGLISDREKADVVPTVDEWVIISFSQFPLLFVCEFEPCTEHAELV